jgi:beta-lactamase class A
MQALEGSIRDLAVGFSGKFTLCLRDRVSGEHFGIDEHDVMLTASVIKVPVLVSMYQAVEEGDISLEQRVTYEERHRCLGSGVLSQLSTGVEMSVRDAAGLMIGISDNSATNMCLELAGGVDVVNQRMRALGLNETTMFGPPGDISRGFDGRAHYVTTAHESAELLAMIADHRVGPPAACQDMLRLLRRNQKREKLGRHLPWTGLNTLPDPRNNWLASKGGTYMDVRNDVGLMHGPRGECIVSAFTEGGKGRGFDHEGVLFLGDLGKLVWDSLRGAT